MRVSQRILATYVLLALLGCNRQPPPIQEAKPVAKLTKDEFVELDKPKESSAEAQRWLTDMVKAHSNNKPEALKSLHKIEFVRRGKLRYAALGVVDAEWRTHINYPEYFKLRSEVQSEALIVTIHSYTPKGAWQYLPKGGLGEKIPMNKEATESIKAQLREDTLALIFPMLEPSVIVQLHDEKKIGASTCQGIHFWSAQHPYALLYIDKQTKLLKQLIYNGLELGLKTKKELTLEEYQDFEGIKIWNRAKTKGNDLLIADWTSLTMKKLPDLTTSFFDNP